MLRKWVREFASDAVQPFPGQGQMKPEQLELTRLRREVAKLKAERDMTCSPEFRPLISLVPRQEQDHAAQPFQ